MIPLTIAGFIRLWRTPELRFIAVAATVILSTCWPGCRARCTTPTEWRRPCWRRVRWRPSAGSPAPAAPRLRRGVVVAAPLVGMAIILPAVLPIVPAGHVHDLPASSQHADIGDTIGWPQLTHAVAAQDAALVRAGQPPTSIFTGYLRRGRRARRPRLRRSPAARALRPQRLLDVGAGAGLGPPVLVVDALGQLRPDFASCRPLTTYYAPVPRAQRLDRHPDRRLHRPDGQLAHAVAAPEALRLTGPRDAGPGASAGHAIIGS